MSQHFGQSLSQQMRMEQRLTPQLIQSMAILQKPVAELEAYLESALESNAALELVEGEPVDGAAAPGEAPTPTAEREFSDADAFARLNKLARAYELDDAEHAPFRNRRAASDDGYDAKMGAMANTAGRQVGLHEHLMDQWSLLEMEAEARRAGEAIIDHIDPDGYLRVRLEVIADSVRPALREAAVEEALTEVHKLEPAGVAARDVVECLLRQIDALPGDNRLERSLIERHLDDLANNRLPAIAAATGYSTGEITEAMRAMKSTLCLHPGYLVGDRSVPPIRPDVIVDYAHTGAGLTVRLARGNAPTLRIREEVVKLARSSTNGQATREFARKHVDEASTLIDAVRFRQTRLLDVARAVVEKQRAFFDVGPAGLKVLRMGDLATELECDPSTISRTVSDKYVQTPRGIYPMRYFFTGGTETDDGESVGWDRVKSRVGEMVEAEDRRKPLNDDQIAAMLKKEGIEISRRTVAKYRGKLGIPAGRKRREY